MLRNRMLGGVSSFALFAPEGAGAGGSGSEDKHTDVLLHEIAGKAFDDASGEQESTTAAREASTAARVEPAGKPAGAEKTIEPAKAAAQGDKRAQESNAGADRGDGRTKGGQFAGKAAAADPKGAAATVDPAKTGTEVAKAADGQGDQAAATRSAPPGGWSVTAKAAWDALPQAVRDAVAARELEVSNGFKQFEGLKPFAERAAKGGQTLAQAMTAYTGIEDLVRRDFPSAMMHIAGNAGMTQHEAARTFAQLAQRLGFQFQASSAQTDGGSPGDQKLGADPNVLRQLLAPVLEPMLQKVTTLETSLTRQAEASLDQRRTASQQVVDAFRQDPANKFYDNLEPTIFGLLKNGMVPRTGDLAADLRAAYDAAARMHPEVSEILLNEKLAAAGEAKRTAEQEAADRARAASKSVTGAPAAGARDNPRRGPGDQLHQLAAQAYDAALGRV